LIRAKFSDVASAANRIPLSIRWSLYAYAFLLPFERTDLGVFSGNLSIARLSGLFVMGACLLYPRLTFTIPHPAFLCFGAYLLIHFALGAWLNDPWYAFLGSFLTRTQVILFAWLLSAVLRDVKVATRTFLAFAAGSMFLVVAMLSGLPGFVDTFKQQGVERVTFGGADPNFVGASFALAMVAALGWILGKSLIPRSYKALLVPASLLLPMGIFLTRSRAAIICLFAGVVLYLLPLDRLKTPLRRAPVVFVCLAVFTILVLNSPESLTRLGSTLNDGNSSGRDKLLAAAYPLILEKPVFGWGPVVWQTELGYDIHNHFVYLFLEGGIVGATPYLLGFLLCCWSVWRCRNTDWGKLCFAALMTMFLTNLSINFPSFKAMWLVIAACASLTLRNVGPKMQRHYRT
jgi:O-antigen ligase